VTKWTGEVSFSAYSSETRTHLKNLATGNPHIDFAFLITIEESPKWESPHNTDDNAKTLRAEPYLVYDDFIQHLPAKNFGRIVVGGGSSGPPLGRSCSRHTFVALMVLSPLAQAPKAKKTNTRHVGLYTLL